MTAGQTETVRGHGAEFRLDGRIALVTGASSGLGARIARAFNLAGAQLVLTGRDVHRLEHQASGLTNSPRVIAGDLRDPSFRATLIQDVRTREGRLDVLVNAAGACDNGALEAQALADVADIVELDLVVPIDLCRLAAPLLFDGRGPSVINISSIFGQISSGGGMAGYHAAKGGLIVFTRHLAEQWGPRGVRVNALAPGFFPTPLTGELTDPRQRDRICRRTLLGRVPELSEIDGPAVFLAAAASSYVTGQVLTVDGGWTAN